MGNSNNTSTTTSGMKLARSGMRLMLLPAMLMLAYPQAARADDQAVIDYREQIMMQLDAESGALGLMLSGQIPPDSLGLEARSIALAAKAARKAFEPNVP